MPVVTSTPVLMRCLELALLRIQTSKKHVKQWKNQPPDSAATFIRSSLHNFHPCRGPDKDEDTVALRMWSYLLESDAECRRLEPLIKEHREDMRQVAIDKRAKKAAAAVRKAQAKGVEDQDLMETLDAVLLTGEPLPESLAGGTTSVSVSLHIKNNGMEIRDVTECVILAMCQRGLCVSTTRDGDCDPFLSCEHHSKKQFQSLWQALSHFQSYGYHRKE